MCVRACVRACVCVCVCPFFFFFLLFFFSFCLPLFRRFFFFFFWTREGVTGWKGVGAFTKCLQTKLCKPNAVELHCFQFGLHHTTHGRSQFSRRAQTINAVVSQSLSRTGFQSPLSDIYFYSEIGRRRKQGEKKEVKRMKGRAKKLPPNSLSRPFDSRLI